MTDLQVLKERARLLNQEQKDLVSQKFYEQQLRVTTNHLSNTRRMIDLLDESPDKYEAYMKWWEDLQNRVDNIGKTFDQKLAIVKLTSHA